MIFSIKKYPTYPSLCFFLFIGLRKGKTTRKAHTVSNVVSLRKPVIDSDSAGKIPVNVRQKYLDTIVDECLKIFPNNVAAAYERFSPFKI